MRFTLRDNLPFVAVTLAYQGTAITVPHVLIDTGSARTIFAFDVVSGIQIIPAPEDILYAIRGVGGMETLFSLTVDYMQVGMDSMLLVSTSGVVHGELVRNCRFKGQSANIRKSRNFPN